MPKVQAAAAKTPSDPIVQAMLAGKVKRAGIGERVLSATANVVANATLVTGRLIESVDAERYTDGTKTQKYLNLKHRSEYWKQFGNEHGLSDDDVAAIIAS